MFQGMRYIYTVYQEQSFSKAAKKLFVSQPALSSTVKRIEERIGCPIFDRSTKPLTLTECGKKYIEAAEQILAIENDFSRYLNDWNDLKTGQLVLGGSSLYSSWILPSLMGTFSQKFPLIRLELVEESTAELTRLLHNGRIDLLLDNCSLNPETFRSMIYKKEQLLLAVPKSFPSTSAAAPYAVSIEKLKSGAYQDETIPAVPLCLFRDDPFILLKPENDTRIRAVEMLREEHIVPNIRFEPDQQLTAYQITTSGMGISFVSDTLLTKAEIPDTIVCYKLNGRYSQRNISFYWKSGRYISKAMDQFLKMVCNC